jgi:TRAP-type mannitol/chloroaromatic compound transport system substrate-binding protein
MKNKQAIARSTARQAKRAIRRSVQIERCEQFPASITVSDDAAATDLLDTMTNSLGQIIAFWNKNGVSSAETCVDAHALETLKGCGYYFDGSDEEQLRWVLTIAFEARYGIDQVIDRLLDKLQRMNAPSNGLRA